MLIHQMGRRPAPARALPPGGAPQAASAGRARVRQTLTAARGTEVRRRPAELIDDFDFAGRRVAGGISPTLRDRLRNVQAHLRAEYDALQPAPGVSFEAWAGVTSIRSWRRNAACPPRNCSFHQSGSAVDINYDLQPYIATRTTVGGTTHYGGEAAGASLQDQRRAAVQVYDDAVRFTRTPTDAADVSARAGGEATVDVYRRFLAVSDALQAYFGFVFRAEPRAVLRRPLADIEGATEAQLLSAIPETERLPEAEGIARLEARMESPAFQAAHPEWPRTPREQYFRILRDYEHVRIPMVRGNPEARPPDTRNPTRGFLDMPEWLVMALVDVGNLRWGASDFGHRASGDVHHFDLGTHALTPDGQP